MPSIKSPKSSNSPKHQQPSPRPVKKWLQNAYPPNSYKIQLSFVDLRDNLESVALIYPYKKIKFIDTPHRFQNRAQAKIFATQNYSSISYRIKGSRYDPNYTYD